MLVVLLNGDQLKVLDAVVSLVLVLVVDHLPTTRDNPSGAPVNHVVLVRVPASVPLAGVVFRGHDQRVLTVPHPDPSTTKKRVGGAGIEPATSPLSGVRSTK